MFVGQYAHGVDEKGRIIIPSAFREKLGEKVYLSRGIERCIFLYPEDSWGSLYAKIASLSLTRKETRDFARLFLSTVAITTLDAQGRIALPAYLREYARIGRKVMLIGVGTRVEIWGEELWREYVSTVEERFAEISEHIVDTGI